MQQNITLEGEEGIKRRIRAAVDTGATYTMIPWEVAEALGYEPELSKEKVTLVTASGVETAPIIQIKKITVLGQNVNPNVAKVEDAADPRRQG